jgi:transcriptional regulator with XRE-family HTH domain
MTTAQAGPGGSTVRRILLGSRLRRLREARGCTREAAGYAIRASQSKISRMELGRVSFKERDVADLLTLYGISEESERRSLLGLVREANAVGWWHNYADVLPSWFQTYVGLEESASDIQALEVQFVHGLLQTEDYIRAVMAHGHIGASRTEIDRRVGLRAERQKLLFSENAPRVVALMDECALHRPIGGRPVLRSQLRHLLEIGELPNVSVRVLPFDFVGCPGGGWPFTLLRFPDVELSDVVYVEQLTGAVYIDKREEVEQYDRVMSGLLEAGLSAEATRDKLRAVLQES